MTEKRFTIYDFLRPILFRLPPETAHELAVKFLKSNFADKFIAQENSFSLGEIECFGLRFKNPVGVAAGFDKNGLVADQLARFGFGFVEVGTTTFHPQPGNPKPRLFRLPKDYALINRAGFNNDGTAVVTERLRKNRPRCVLGMNIGKSKIVPVEAATEDYLKSFDLVYDIADYIVVNVSSPNTPNLRELQKADALENLLAALQKRNRELSGNQTKKPLLVKIAPDLTEGEIEAICDVSLKFELAGIVATNTTVARENLKTSRAKIERIGAGGLSGRPIEKRSTEVVETIFRRTKGKLPIIGVGGIFNAADAFEKIAAGASLIQLYTGFVYNGLNVASDINKGLSEIFRERGLKTFNEAIGINSK